MANPHVPTYSGNSTRPHWGGPNSTVDQHLEIYDGIRDSAFVVTAQFVALSAQRSVADRSNNYRMDRVNKSQVLGRAAGGDITAQKVTSDKVNIIVEMMMYIRNPIDYMDDWTAPDFLATYAQNNGSTFAKFFDQAHIIRLQKARDWVAPAHLKPAFSDGIQVDVTLKGGNALNSQDLTDNAEALYVAIGKAVETLADRDVPLENMVALTTNTRFGQLLNHPKLINKDYTANNGDFAGRKIVMVHGIPLATSTAFPRAPITGHILSTATNGNAFDVDADDIKNDFIIFDKQLSLVTVTARPFTSRFWDSEIDMCNILDCWAMYTVDTRRPDTVATLSVTETVTP
jgi:hypothetical protein